MHQPSHDTDMGQLSEDTYMSQPSDKSQLAMKGRGPRRYNTAGGIIDRPSARPPTPIGPFKGGNRGPYLGPYGPQNYYFLGDDGFRHPALE